MLYEKELIKNLKPREDNIRYHPENQVDAMISSIKKFGQVRPIVVDEDNNIIIGHCLFLALQKMGDEEAIIFKKIGLSENEKIKLMIADNKIYELGNMNLGELNLKLSELSLENDLDIPGFDEGLLKELFNDSKLEKDIKNENEYGNFNDKTIEDINSKEISVSTEKNTDEIKLNNKEIKIEYQEDKKPKPYIICSKCNEKIWL